MPGRYPRVTRPGDVLTKLLSETAGARIGALLAPPADLEFDYSQPAGEPGLLPPDSLSWRIFKNPVTLFIGGVAAVILELAEPSVRAGVWDHSSFRRDPLTRLKRTGAAAMMTVYGPRSAAERMIAGVVRAHGRVRGINPRGESYYANDPRLLDWVQATATFGFMEAYGRFARRLSPAEKSRAFAEAQPAAALYGATGAPRSVSEWRALLDGMMPSLEHSAVLEEFLSIMSEAELVPGPLRSLQQVMLRAAFEIVPAPLRAKLLLEERRLSALQLAGVRAAAMAVDRIPASDAPPVQASLRMGLGPDFLYP